MKEETLWGLPEADSIGGLSRTAVAEREHKGLSNRTLPRVTPSPWQIWRNNLFTLFNFVNLTLAILILSFSTIRNALFLGVAIFSTAISIFQEFRAKRTLDKLSLLKKSQVTVIREGKSVAIDFHQIVVDDVLLLKPGMQIPVDGICLYSAELMVNEANISGEPEDIPKNPQDTLTSGSAVMAGKAYMKVTAVGENSFVSRLSQEAKITRRKKSPLMRGINRLVRVLAIGIIPVGLILFFSKISQGMNIELAVLGTASALVGMIPQGLILLTNVAFAVGVINLGRRRVVVQALPAIEALARVDLLCLDKTGTLTNGQLVFKKIVPWSNFALAEAERALVKLTAVSQEENPTAQALAKVFVSTDQEKTTPEKLIAFSSVRKFSGALWEEGAILLGAPSFLLPHDSDFLAVASTYAAEGFRVLALVKGSKESVENPVLRQPIALLLLEDCLRPAVGATMSYFAFEEVKLKVITGDDPGTAAHIATQAGIEAAEKYIDLGKDPSALLGELPLEVKKDPEYYTVFGRVSPFQKRSLVKLFKREGHDVAMVGDGVNDVLALKEADCSIAMAGGSEASQSVADLVFLDGDFSVMAPALNEGRRVINNIEKVAAMYVNKTVYSTILALVFIFLQRPYPYAPIQLSLVSILTIGIPSFLITLRPDTRRVKNNFARKIILHAIPSGLSVAIGLLVIQSLESLFAWSDKDISTLSTFYMGVIGLFLVVQLSLPLSRFRFLMVLLLSGAFMGAFLVFPDFFAFSPFSGFIALVAFLLAAVGCLLVAILKQLLAGLLRLWSGREI